jgi:hypothetical protein
MMEFIFPALVLLAAIGYFTFKHFQKKKADDRQPIADSPNPGVVVPNPGMPSPVAPGATVAAQDTNLHPSWKALGITYHSALISGFDPTKQAPDQFYTYKPPESRKEADTSHNTITAKDSGAHFTRRLENGRPEVFTLDASKPVLLSLVPTSDGTGFPTLGPSPNVCVVISGPHGTIQKNTGSGLQILNLSVSEGPWTVSLTSSDYSGGVKLQATYR